MDQKLDNEHLPSVCLSKAGTDEILAYLETFQTGLPESFGDSSRSFSCESFSYFLPFHDFDTLSFLTTVGVLVAQKRLAIYIQQLPKILLSFFSLVTVLFLSVNKTSAFSRISLFVRYGLIYFQKSLKSSKAEKQLQPSKQQSKLAYESYLRKLAYETPVSITPVLKRFDLLKVHCQA